MHGLAWRKQGGLIAAETNREWHPILQEGHERDLNGFSCSIQRVPELHYADHTLNCARLDGTPKENISAASTQQEQ